MGGVNMRLTVLSSNRSTALAGRRWAKVVSPRHNPCRSWWYRSGKLRWLVAKVSTPSKGHRQHPNGQIKGRPRFVVDEADVFMPHGEQGTGADNQARNDHRHEAAHGPGMHRSDHRVDGESQEFDYRQAQERGQLELPALLDTRTPGTRALR